MDLNEILYGDGDIEGGVDSILLNHIASTFRILWMFVLLRWVQLLKLLVDLDDMLYGGDTIQVDLYSMF
jgi:hypothetical protein